MKAGWKLGPILATQPHCDAAIFIPTNVAALNPRSANSVALSSGIAKSLHVQTRKTPPSTTFHTIN